MSAVFADLRRWASAALAIVLGVAFATITLAFGSTMNATLRAQAAGSIQGAKVILTAGENDLTPDVVRAVEQTPGVDKVRPVLHTFLSQADAGQHQILAATNLEALSPGFPLEGRLPRTASEGLVNRMMARERHVAPGSTIRVEGASGIVPVTVVGVADLGSESLEVPGLPTVIGTRAGVAAWAGSTSYRTLYVTGSPAPDALASTLKRTPAVAKAAPVIRTAAQETEQRLRDFTQGSEVLMIGLLAFAVIAAFVAALVIANTFAIVIAQRTRALALARCVGAARGDIFRQVLGEALALGASASVVGAAIGWLVGRFGLAALAPAIGQPLTTDVTVRDVLVPVAVGVVVTALAALVPARRATRVPPLAALRPDLAAPSAGRTGRLRIGVGSLAAVVGFAAVAAAGVLPLVNRHTDVGLAVLLGVAGGMVSFVGVLMLAPVLVPALIRLGTPLARLGGVPGELAVENARRNPQRTAATASALLIGVTLVTMMTIGAQVGTASITRQLDEKFPTDAMVESVPGLSPQALETLRRQPDVASVSPVAFPRTELPSMGEQVMGISPNIAATLRSAERFAGLADGVLLAPKDAGLTDGQRVTLTGPSGSLELTARLNPKIGGPAVTVADAQRLDKDAPLGAMLRYHDSVTDRVAADERVGKSLQGIATDYRVMSANGPRAQLTQAVDVTLLVVVSLLAVAVAIALVGVGNTLGLSVLERRQESGLLRALGLTRAQTRAMLGAEALATASVAVVLGLLLGAGYAVAGISALLASEAGIVIDIPWLRLLLIVAVTLLAGWLASVLPGARAAKVPPAAALTYE